jgi:spore coat polysaccharide biosynthesis protein SpsF
MKFGAIVQARMSSQRFPKKTLYQVHGKPLLEYLLERLNRCDVVDEIVVATSNEETDLPIVDYCRDHQVSCFQGSHEDVAGRFSEALKQFGFEAFVRISADSPLLDINLILTGVDLFKSEEVDLVTNIQKRTFPKGQSVEICLADTFQRAYKHMKDAEDREHVTRYFYQNSAQFKILNIESPKKYGNIQLSVDTSEDMERFSAIVARMKRPHWDYSLAEVLELHREVSL